MIRKIGLVLACSTVTSLLLFDATSAVAQDFQRGRPVVWWDFGVNPDRQPASEPRHRYVPTIRLEDVRTRADAVVYALESNGIGCPSRDRHVVFSDVPRDHPHSFAIGCAAYHRIVLGYGDGTFGPDEPISPEHFSTIRRRAFWHNN